MKRGISTLTVIRPQKQNRHFQRIAAVLCETEKIMKETEAVPQSILQ
jgi:hypothetical protein